MDDNFVNSYGPLQDGLQPIHSLFNDVADTFPIFSQHGGYFRSSAILLISRSSSALVCDFSTYIDVLNILEVIIKKNRILVRKHLRTHVYRTFLIQIYLKNTVKFCPLPRGTPCIALNNIEQE